MFFIILGEIILIFYQWVGGRTKSVWYTPLSINKKCHWRKEYLIWTAKIIYADRTVRNKSWRFIMFRTCMLFPFSVWFAYVYMYLRCKSKHRYFGLITCLEGKSQGSILQIFWNSACRVLAKKIPNSEIFTIFIAGLGIFQEHFANIQLCSRLYCIFPIDNYGFLITEMCGHVQKWGKVQLKAVLLRNVVMFLILCSLA